MTLFELEDVSTPRRSKRVKLEDALIPDLEDTVKDEEKPIKIEIKANSNAKKASSPRKPKVIKQTLATPHPAPPKWQETYDTIKDMRSRIIAPVDTMGCDQAQLKEVDPKVSGLRFYSKSAYLLVEAALEPTILNPCVPHAVFSDER